MILFPLGYDQQDKDDNKINNEMEEEILD